MTAEFFFKDESSVKARQTVFFAYKSPEAGSSLAREGETLMRCHPIWGNMWHKLAVGICNATHKWVRLLNTDIPGFVCVCTCCTTLPKKGIVCSVCLCMCICTSSVGKNSHMMFCCKFPWHLDPVLDNLPLYVPHTVGLLSKMEEVCAILRAAL